MRYDFRSKTDEPLYLRGHLNMSPQFEEPLQVQVDDMIVSDERDPQWSGRIRCYKVIGRVHSFDKYGEHKLTFILEELP